MVEYIQGMLNRTSASVAFHMGDPWAFKNVTDGEMRIKNRNSRDPEQGPAPEPGDWYIFVAAIAGIMFGGGIGVLIAVNTVGANAIFIGLIAGCIIGGLIGAYFGSYLKNRKRSEQARLPHYNEKGPFSD